MRVFELLGIVGLVVAVYVVVRSTGLSCAAVWLALAVVHLTLLQRKNSWPHTSMSRTK